MGDVEFGGGTETGRWDGEGGEIAHLINTVKK